ncbi:hypothetical protein BVU76_05390 [Mycolicibacterium porcinum]|nr:hypothetical protein BVU76_05390 [Mycolicibacterium porcinum]
MPAASFHPGFVNNNFGPASGSRVLAVMQRAHTERLVGITPEAACDQMVWLASDGSQHFEPAGEYFVNAASVARTGSLTAHNARVSYGSGRRRWSVRKRRASR